MYNYLLYKWRIKIDPKCDCDADKQTMDHIVNECTKRKFHATLTELNTATDQAIEWLGSGLIRHQHLRTHNSTEKSLTVNYLCLYSIIVLSIYLLKFTC